MAGLNGQHNGHAHGPIPAPVAGQAVAAVAMKAVAEPVEASLEAIIQRLRGELALERDRRVRVMGLVSQLAGYLDAMKQERRMPSDVLALTKLSEIAHEALRST